MLPDSDRVTWKPTEQAMAFGSLDVNLDPCRFVSLLQGLNVTVMSGNFYKMMLCVQNE